MESNEPDPEFIVAMVEKAMTTINNEERAQVQKQLTEYEQQFNVIVYAKKVIECLMRDELIEHSILHLRKCIYLKEFFRKFIGIEESIEEIVSMLIHVCINPSIKTSNRYIIAEALESAFHYLAINIANLKVNGKLQLENEEDEEYSISKAFAENILRVLVD